MNREPHRDTSIIENPVNVDSNGQRQMRFLASVACLVLIGVFVVFICNDALQMPFTLMLFIFVGYIIAQGTLITVLAGQLYQQHEMRELRFGIGSLMIITTMIALPLGIASLVQHLGVPKENGFGAREAGFAVGLSMYFAVLPLLYCAEAVAVWLSRRRKYKTNIESRKIED